jgi:hypothetical protein
MESLRKKSHHDSTITLQEDGGEHKKVEVGEVHELKASKFSPI